MSPRGMVSEVEPATAAIALLGDELLLNPSLDRNGAYLTGEICRIGIRVREIRILPDGVAEIATAVNSLRSRYTYVFLSGGLGPTHDDVTTAAVASAFGVARKAHPAAVAMLRAFHLSDVPEMRIQTAHIPEGAEVIEDPISGTPGFRLENVFVMAGSPEILRCMFESVLPALRRSEPLLSRSLKVRAFESQLSDALREMQNRFPHVAIGCYPYFPASGPAVNIVLRSTDVGALERCADSVRSLLSEFREIAENLEMRS
jgi:molybdenum cofactor synthesis domain-containing protein